MSTNQKSHKNKRKLDPIVRPQAKNKNQPQQHQQEDYQQQNINNVQSNTDENPLNDRKQSNNQETNKISERKNVGKISKQDITSPKDQSINHEKIEEKNQQLYDTSKQENNNEAHEKTDSKGNEGQNLEKQKYEQRKKMVFDSFSKLNYSADKCTFDDVANKSNYLSQHTFIHFCKVFGLQKIIQKHLLRKDEKTIKNNQIHKTSLIREQINQIFKKNSKNQNAMNEENFNSALEQIAQLQYEEDQSQNTKIDRLMIFMNLHNSKAFSKKMKNVEKEFREKNYFKNFNAPKIPDKAQYKYDLTPCNGKQEEQLRLEIEERKLERKLKKQANQEWHKRNRTNKIQKLYMNGPLKSYHSSDKLFYSENNRKSRVQVPDQKRMTNIIDKSTKIRPKPSQIIEKARQEVNQFQNRTSSYSTANTRQQEIGKINRNLIQQQQQRSIGTINKNLQTIKREIGKINTNKRSYEHSNTYIGKIKQNTEDNIKKKRKINDKENLQRSYKYSEKQQNSIIKQINSISENLKKQFEENKHTKLEKTKRNKKKYPKQAQKQQNDEMFDLQKMLSINQSRQQSEEEDDQILKKHFQQQNQFYSKINNAIN